MPWQCLCSVTQPRSFYPMLKKVWVKVLVKAILKFDLWGRPDDFIGERDLGIGLQFDAIFRGQIHVYDLVLIVSNFELLVGPNVQIIALILHLTHDTCVLVMYFKVVNRSTDNWLVSKFNLHLDIRVINLNELLFWGPASNKDGCQW